MARVHGKDITAVNIDTNGGTPTDLKAETISLDFSASSETHDTTTIGDQWREFTAGLKGGDEISHNLMYDNTSTTGTWALYTARLGQAAQTVSFGDGVRTISAEAIITKLSLPVAVGDMIKFTATHKITGAITFS
jgi:hypothetical protein